jgi:hypothetical protein
MQWKEFKSVVVAKHSVWTGLVGDICASSAALTMPNTCRTRRIRSNAGPIDGTAIIILYVIVRRLDSTEGQ